MRLVGPCLLLLLLVASAHAHIVDSRCTTAGYASAGLTSSVGKAFVFDSRASGFIRGEGCCTAVLRAVAVTATVHLCGSAVRQDGRSASLTAPNGRAQLLLLSAVLMDASTASEQVQQVEAAANGSALGIPAGPRTTAERGGF